MPNSNDLSYCYNEDNSKIQLNASNIGFGDTENVDYVEHRNELEGALVYVNSGDIGRQFDSMSQMNSATTQKDFKADL